MPSLQVQRKKSKKKRKSKTPKVRVRPEDIWYGGSHKYRKGAGLKTMNWAIDKFETWMLTKPQASASEKNKFLDTLCKVI